MVFDGSGSFIYVPGWQVVQLFDHVNGSQSVAIKRGKCDTSPYPIAPRAISTTIWKATIWLIGKKENLQNRFWLVQEREDFIRERKQK
jgi:hypothetical protein